MKKIIKIATVVLTVFSFRPAMAQEGLGLQTYISSVRVLHGSAFSAYGLGGGVKINSRFVVSLSAYLTYPPAFTTTPAVLSNRLYNRDHTAPFEFGASVSYRILEDNPTFYALAGYSFYPPGGALVRGVHLMHAGVGLAPFKGWFDVYPELSIAIPLDPHLTAWEGGNMIHETHVYVPVMFRLTLKAYFDP